MAAEAVKVVVRCRPLNARERALGCAAVVSVDSARGRCALRNPAAAGQPPKAFAFDGAYGQEHGTEQIYNEVAYPLVEVRGAPRQPGPGAPSHGFCPRRPPVPLGAEVSERHLGVCAQTALLPGAGPRPGEAAGEAFAATVGELERRRYAVQTRVDSPSARERA